jgi:hypothetical protein
MTALLRWVLVCALILLAAALQPTDIDSIPLWLAIAG